MSASRAWRIERQGLAHHLFGAFQQRFERLRAQGTKDEHAGARQQSRVELERRILRRRADQRDRAVLHHRQKGILLRAVEAMDLVDEQERALPLRAARARGVEDLLQFRDAGMDRRELHERVVAAKRRSAARPSSCRCPAAPRRSSSRATAPQAGASALHSDRSDAPGPKPRRATSAAAARRAAPAAAQAWGRGRREGSWRFVPRRRPAVQPRAVAVATALRAWRDASATRHSGAACRPLAGGPLFAVPSNPRAV